MRQGALQWGKLWRQWGPVTWVAHRLSHSLLYTTRKIPSGWRAPDCVGARVTSESDILFTCMQVSCQSSLFDEGEVSALPCRQTARGLDLVNAIQSLFKNEYVGRLSDITLVLECAVLGSRVYHYFIDVVVPHLFQNLRGLNPVFIIKWVY